MKYQANPITVEAKRILGVGAALGGGEGVESGSIALLLEGGDTVAATPAMMARMTPVAGDYWVRQEDGYAYLNPKDVFERKYSLVTSGQVTIVALAFREALKPGMRFSAVTEHGSSIAPTHHVAAVLDESDVSRERRNFMAMFGDPMFAALLTLLRRSLKV